MTVRTRALIALQLSTLFVACATPRSQGAAPHRPVDVSPPPSPSGLYGAEEALSDALAGPWTYVGTGPWPGNGRMHACLFRNDRVLLVNVYCGIKDTQAFRFEVYSPTRGHVRITAESKVPVSERQRDEYFSFATEAEPPPQPSANLPALHLQMSLPELAAYEERRYAAYLPACYAGTEVHRERSGCLGALEPEFPAFAAQHASFLERASDQWYRVVRDSRALALRYGRDPD